MNRLARWSESSYTYQWNFMSSKQSNLKIPRKKPHKPKKRKLQVLILLNKSTVLLTVCRVVWGWGGCEMFIRWYCVIFLKSNIGNHILKQSHKVSLSSVYSVFPNMLPTRKSHPFKPISYMNLNTNLWQNSGIWELPSNVLLMLQIISLII